MQAYKFYGDNGETIERGPIPAELQAQADKLRHEMLDNLSLVNDESPGIAEDKVTPELFRKCLRDSTIALKCTPVMLGSALGNKGVQLLLDGVCTYLPEPRDVENIALNLDKAEEPVVLESDTSKPLVMLAFKLEDGRYGQLTYIRVYQGSSQGRLHRQPRNGKKVKVGRLVRMHADEMEDIDSTPAPATSRDVRHRLQLGRHVHRRHGQLAMTSMFVPKPVIRSRSAEGQQAPRQHVEGAAPLHARRTRRSALASTPRASETIISGMGELHLDVYIERMKREYKAEVVTVAAAGRVPRDHHASRPTSTTPTRSRPVARASTARSPATSSRSEGDFEFVDEIRGGAIPREFIPAVEKGFKSMLKKGRASACRSSGCA